MKFTESKLEQAFTSLLSNEGYPHYLGDSIKRNPKMGLAESEVLREANLRSYFIQVCANQVPSKSPSKLKLNKQMKFTESKLEKAFTSLLAKEGYPHFLGDSIERNPKMGLA